MTSNFLSLISLAWFNNARKDSIMEVFLEMFVSGLWKHTFSECSLFQIIQQNPFDILVLGLISTPLRNTDTLFCNLINVFPSDISMFLHLFLFCNSTLISASPAATETAILSTACVITSSLLIFPDIMLSSF